MPNKNRGRQNFHAYDPSEMERLRRIPLPPKLKCNMCLKNFNTAMFSEKQLTDVRLQISRSNKITTNPRCHKCTGSAPVEIECTMCHKIKGLEEYAKSQRRKPDDSTCFACMNIQLSREPVDDIRYEDPTKAFITTKSSGRDLPDYFSSASSASSARDTASSTGDWEDTESTDGDRRRNEGGGIALSAQFQSAMSISGNASDTLIETEFSYKPTNGTNPGTWSEVAGTKSWHTGTATASSSGLGFDPNRYGRPGAPSVSGSVHSFNSSVAERSQAGSDHVEMRNGFARVKAYKPEMQEDPFFADDGESSSSSDDDDDDSDGADTVI